MILPAQTPGARGALPLCFIQFPPSTRRQVAEFEIADAHANQPQRGMADGRGHSPHLTVFSFNEFERDPAIRNILPETNGRIARQYLRLRIEQRRAAWQSFLVLNDHAAFELLH
jgi:hypothetical protein